MVAVAANGNIFPCHQLSGTYELNGDIPGNVKKESLKHLLSASQYLCEVCTTVDKSGSTTENAEIVSISNTVREDAGHWQLC